MAQSALAEVEQGHPKVGALIRARRRQQHMTLMDLGAVAEVSVGYLSQVERYTAPLALNLFIDATSGESAWGMLFAMSVITLLPLFVLFVIFQRQIAEGIATTGLKG